jgi:prepilin-type N-terminal cleavage/methylation domain-containing protein
MVYFKKVRMVPSSRNLLTVLKTVKGFTLAELLMALAILGVIATFTIPNVLNTFGNQTIKANGKAAISTLSAVLYEGCSNGKIKVTTNYFQLTDYLKTKLNYTRFCALGETDGPCEDHSPGGEMGPSTSRFILPSGAVVAVYGIDFYNPGDVHLLVDATGNSPPNNEPAYSGTATDSDIAVLWFNRSQTTLSLGWRYGDNLRPCTLIGDYGANRYLVYEEWFK